MKKLMTFVFAAAFAVAAHADNKVNLKDTALKLVPGSKLIKEDGNEFDLQTSKGTVIEVELNNDGTVDEASGNAVNGGDVFTPGSNLISLEAATSALKKAGNKPSGEWEYKKSMINGWVYEFEGVENGKDMEYVVSAKNGKILKDKRDLL